jgi:hypothetical protein
MNTQSLPSNRWLRLPLLGGSTFSGSYGSSACQACRPPILSPHCFPGRMPAQAAAGRIFASGTGTQHRDRDI